VTVFVNQREPCLAEWQPWHVGGRNAVGGTVEHQAGAARLTPALSLSVRPQADSQSPYPRR
jgi:hypothetical protein